MVPARPKARTQRQTTTRRPKALAARRSPRSTQTTTTMTAPRSHADMMALREIVGTIVQLDSARLKFVRKAARLMLEWQKKDARNARARARRAARKQQKVGGR